MALPFTPSKRPFERNPMEPNGRAKWQKTSPSVSQANQFKVSPGTVVFRVLCPFNKSGSVIGKGGGIIAKIRQETGAKIKLEESIPGCDERVVVISGPVKDSELRNEQTKRIDNDGNAGGLEDGKASTEDDKIKDDSSITEGLKSVKATSLVQKALLLIFERIVEGEPEFDDGDDASKQSSPSVRLLILSSQVGRLLGKGGSVIKQMSNDSGANIRVLSRDKLPKCASPNDEIVQISGGIDSIRKALQSVSHQLSKFASRDYDFPGDNPPGSSIHQFAPIPRPEAFKPTNYHMPIQGPPFPNRPPYDAPDIPSFPNFHEGPTPGQMQVPPLVFRLLCSNDKVGSVIGKGGNIVRSLQNETGCDIKILETPLESEDRMIVISGPALPGDRISPPQDAVLRVQHRIFLAAPENKDNVALSRILVSSNQIGCLLGKGGSIIAEMRKLSGANIRLLSRDQIPRGVPDNDEIIQVSGDFGAVQEALIQITARLRGHLFRDKAPGLNHPPHPPFLDKMPPFGSYMGRREPSPPRLYGGLPPFQKDVARPHEERTVFPHPIHGSGVSPLGSERLPSTPWAPQGMREGGGPMPLPDFPGAPPKRIGGFPGNQQPPVVTHTTVDVVVPRVLVPSIFGEDGGCLRRIREISEAKITITEARPEAKETTIIISGTPEQTHAAQSLLQAFVLSETSAP